MKSKKHVPKKDVTGRFKTSIAKLDLVGPPRWADYFELSLSKESLKMSLATYMGDDIVGHTIIVMPIKTVRSLARSLIEVITDYENKFGEIE